MCFSNNYIEQQANKMTEEIQKYSLYKFVRVEYMDNGDAAGANGVALISNVILEDKYGALYYVEPNINGLRFAKGQISYSKYRKLQRRNDVNMLVCFFGIIGFFSISMWVLSKMI